MMDLQASSFSNPLLNDESFIEIYNGSGERIYSQSGRETIREAFNQVSGNDETKPFFMQPWIPRDTVDAVVKSQNCNMWCLDIRSHERVHFQVEIVSLSGQKQDPRYLIRYRWLTPSSTRIENLRSHMLLMARQASVASLGAPIAHALNNPLATIRGFAEVLRRRFDNIEKVGYFSEKIVSNADRMKETIEQLRSISKPRSELSTQKSLDLNTLLNRVLEILQEQFKMRSIDLDLRFEPNLPAITGDANMWEAMFLSLLSLSRDCFYDLDDGRKKKISIETSSFGDKVCLVYRDTAGGFPVSGSLAEADPLDRLADTVPSRAAQSFVVLEVLKRHAVVAQFEVRHGDTTEISLEMNAVEASLGQVTDLAV